MTATRTPPPAGHRWPVAILGATGAVGQTFIRCLRNHPWFEIAELAASERSAGKPYADAVRWLEGEFPIELADRQVLACDPSRIRSPIVFSALDAAAASELEPAFARAGATVLSNAKSFRMEPDVPLVIPEVNGSHLALLEKQRETRGWSGGIITNANCAATVATVALAPLHRAFGVRQVFAVTLQAVSGAGYPGVPSLDIVGNVIPFIADEEPKIEREIPKMLGCVDAGGLVPAPIRVSAHANRVPVEHGHTVCMSIKLDKPATPEDARRVLSEWRGDTAVRGLPSAPERALVVSEAADRPQARRDVGAGGGMTVVVGRIRPDPQLDLRLVALGHNTIRGAAGGSVLNAELLVSTGGITRA
jgi:aspartate-semialdehyde dehydrogenase